MSGDGNLCVGAVVCCVFICKDEILVCIGGMLDKVM